MAPARWTLISLLPRNIFPYRTMAILPEIHEVHEAQYAASKLHHKLPEKLNQTTLS